MGTGKRKLTLLALVVVIALLAASCGSQRYSSGRSAHPAPCRTCPSF